MSHFNLTLLMTAVGVVSCSAVMTGSSLACSCRFAPSSEIISTSDVAFEGEVVDVEYFNTTEWSPESKRTYKKERCFAPIGDNIDARMRAQIEREGQPGCAQKTEIRVLNVLKGPLGNLVTIYTTIGGGGVTVNPSGGLVARGHPLGATGIAQVVELTGQLRSTAGPRQVEGARLAVAANTGGIIGKDAAFIGIHILEAG